MSKAVIPPPQYAHLLMGIFLYAWESLDAPAAASSPYSTTTKRPPVEWRALWFPIWWRGRDSNPRPLGYEPNELPLLHPATSGVVVSGAGALPVGGAPALGFVEALNPVLWVCVLGE